MLLEKEQPTPTYRSRLEEEIDLLKESLSKSEVPELFRIAVVGTFKTGKSSFVNKLAEERLAGVETNPETAAISIFRYAETPRAEVKLISHEDWQKMEDLYEDTPEFPGAYRVAGLRGFNKRMAERKNRDGQVIEFDPINADQMVPGVGKALAVMYMSSKQISGKASRASGIFAGQSVISLPAANPLHYFVKDLVVYAPVPLLHDHVELIDTPGLNDTQRYRGELTETLLLEVDAILFLTQSDAAIQPV